MYTNVNEDHSSGTSSGQTGLKKGPWSAAEDAVLMDYVKRNGEGNWNAVQRNTGLMRCGKSCRLRWANHLRPNLKKGGFSPEEERIILDLHSKIGNKWARMASQLPGRTDNEIKNFWNTRLKRLQRAGLPLYPQGYQEGATTFNHSNQEDDQEINCQQNYSSPNPCLSSIFTPCHPQFDFNNFSSFATSKFPLMQNIQLGSFGDDHTINGGNVNGLALPISTSLVSPYSGPSPSSSSTPMYNQNLGFQATITPPLTRPVDRETDEDELEDNHTSFTSIIMGSDHVEPFGSLDVPGIELELPSNQNYFMSYPMSPASFSTTSACGFENSSGDVNYNEGGENCEPGFSEGRRINSGLLDDLLVEAKSLSSRKLVNPIINPDYECSNVEPIGKRKCIGDKSDEEEEGKRAGKRINFSSKNGSEISDETRSYVGSSLSSICDCFPFLVES